MRIKGKRNKQIIKKFGTNLTLYKAYTNHCTNHSGAETKRKKEFSLEAWGKETSNTVSLNKNNEKAENTIQMKEQTRNTEVQINEEEIRKVPEKEFRMIVKMIKNLENRMEKMQESINKDLEELKNTHTKTNSTITEIKNTLEGINSRISKAEERINELEDKMVEITYEEKNKVTRMKKAEDSLRDLRGNIKCTNVQVKGVPEEEERKKGYEKIF